MKKALTIVFIIVAVVVAQKYIVPYFEEIRSAGAAEMALTGDKDATEKIVLDEAVGVLKEVGQFAQSASSKLLGHEDSSDVVALKEEAPSTQTESNGKATFSFDLPPEVSVKNLPSGYADFMKDGQKVGMYRVIKPSVYSKEKEAADYEVNDVTRENQSPYEIKQLVFGSSSSDFPKRMSYYITVPSHPDKLYVMDFYKKGFDMPRTHYWAISFVENK